MRIDSVLDDAQTIVIGNRGPEFQQVHTGMLGDQVTADFVGIAKSANEEDTYDGICW
jgi:hypothetical protein